MFLKKGATFCSDCPLSSNFYTQVTVQITLPRISIHVCVNSIKLSFARACVVPRLFISNLIFLRLQLAMATIKSASEEKPFENPQESSESEEEKQAVVKTRKEKNVEYENQLMDLVFGNKDKLVEQIKKEETVKPKIENESTDRKRKPVWEDSDDEIKVEEGMIKSHITNYLQDPSKKYANHLTNKFQKIVGEPKWAQLDRQEDVGSDSDEEVLKTVGHVLGPSSGTLLKNNLSYRRRKDLNHQSYSEGPKITAVEFHPNSCIALVAGKNGVASLYSIEAKTCDKLHSVQFKKFPISCARLTKDGKEAIFGSSKNYIQTFDLMSGQTHMVSLHRSQMTKMGDFEISPDGEFIAVCGRFGEIHILSAPTKEWLFSLKQEHPCSSLTFSQDSKYLYSHSTENEITVFDLRSQRASHKFIDEGCISGRTITFSPSGLLLATGSGEGIVNIYNAEDVKKSKFPNPIKVISNLSTQITSTKFNPTSEMLGICSVDTADGVKLVHFPSGSVFANFPVNTRNFGNPTAISFSPGGRYMAMGTMTSKVPLFELKHYNYF